MAPGTSTTPGTTGGNTAPGTLTPPANTGGNTTLAKTTSSTCQKVATETLVTNATTSKTYVVHVAMAVNSTVIVAQVIDNVRSFLQQTVAPGLTNCNQMRRRRRLQQGGSVSNVVFGGISVDSFCKYLYCMRNSAMDKNELRDALFLTYLSPSLTRRQLLPIIVSR
jgi:hypothetical protein